MLSTDDVLVEDWQGLESELERLFMIYGYPVDDLQDSRLAPSQVKGSSDAERAPA